MTMAIHENSSSRLKAEPLYARAKAAMVAMLVEGRWKPGEMLPSEPELARELGVSPGTMRKALDALTVEGVLLRRQGKGTFVAQAEDSEVLFRFFRLVANEDGGAAPAFPGSRYLGRDAGEATREEADVLGVAKGAPVWRVERLRVRNEQAILWEKLVLPRSLFPDLDTIDPLPNNVYRLYASRFGLIVSGVEERLEAVACPAEIAGALGVEDAAPVLRIDRRARAIDGAVVEWRVSLVRTDRVHYRNDLR